MDNKFVSSGSRIAGSTVSPPASPNKKPLLRESKLQLNTDLVEDLRRNPEGQSQFAEAIQRSMQNADKLPPKLLMASSVNPAGTALVEESPQAAPSASAAAAASTSVSATKAAKVNNRTPGNIVCGICGAVRYYAYIQQAKKFGTFSCEPCRKFISKVMRDAEQQGGSGAAAFDCVQGRGDCVVPPVAKSSSGEVRCQGCWLKLCLIGYQLEADKYDRLRALLPDAVSEQLPSAADREKEGRSLLPHRGQILEFNRQVPLSRPLFDGLEADDEKGSGRAAKPKSQDNHVVHERLPNGWTKKAVKTLTGEQKGRWVVFLITPDQRMIKTEKQLKLYIGKSGAVIDANIVNFSLPKKTAKVDKALQKKLNKSKSAAPAEFGEVVVKTEPVDADEQLQGELQPTRDETPIHSHSQNTELQHRGRGRPPGSKMTLPVIDPMAALPRSRRRETKVPLKYRHDLGDFNKKTTPSKEKSASLVAEPTMKPVENGLEEEDGSVEVNEGDSEGRGSTAKKSPPMLQQRSSGLIGVGTFSIDEQSVRGK